jgi:hypothetical protein
MSAELGIVHLRSGVIDYGWIFQVFLGFICVFVAIHNTIRRKRPTSVMEWLNDRAKPPLMFDKKDG